MPRTRSQLRLFDLVMWVVLSALVFGFARELARVPQQEQSLTPRVMLLGLGFGIWYVTWRAVRAKRTGPACEECGRQFNPRGQPADTTLCARCRHQSLPRAQAKQQQRVAVLILVLGLTVVMALVGLPFWNTRLHLASLGLLAWILYPLLALFTTLTLLTGTFAALTIIVLIRNWLQRFEKPVFARARNCARDEGTIARVGPLTIWWSGANDPVAYVTEQMQASRQDFERLVDKPIDLLPLRVLVFHDRRAFSAFHRNIVAGHSEVECLYSGRPARMLTLSNEIPRFRAVEDSRCLRNGFVLYLLETLRGSLSAYWLQSGLAATLSCDAGRNIREQLLRKMKVAIHNGADLKAPDFFSRLTALQSREMIGSLVDHSLFVRYAQWRAQAHSVVEYLAGSDATPDRLARFRSFLCDLNTAPDEEPVLARHFDHGFDTLLEHWRGWINEQSLASDPIAPPELRAAIVDRLFPVIVDRSKKAYDRILAMRSLGTAGYALGADALIGVLREQDDRFTPTAAWTLESMSGLPLGSDANRWSEWWAARDPNVRGESERTEPLGTSPPVAHARS